MSFPVPQTAATPTPAFARRSLPRRMQGLAPTVAVTARARSWTPPPCRTGSQLESPAVAKGFARDYAGMWDQRYHALASALDRRDQAGSHWTPC